MKVVAFNGSPRAKGNTQAGLNIVCGELEKAGIETEIILMGHKLVQGCLACYDCYKNKDQACSNKKDEVNDWIGKLIAADGIILASPTYVSNVSAPMKALIDRACLVVRANGTLLRRKVGATVTAVRRAGALPTLDAMNHFFTVTEMMVVGSSYWNLGIGREPGEVLKDEEGVKTYHTLGENMAWLLHKINAG